MRATVGRAPPFLGTTDLLVKSVLIAAANEASCEPLTVALAQLFKL